MRRFVSPPNLARFARHYSRYRIGAQFPISGGRPRAQHRPVVGTVLAPWPPATVVQRRFLLGPFFRLARSGVTVAVGAAAGGAAYANHKFSEATSSISDRFEKVSDWFGGVVDKIDLPDFSASGDRATSSTDPTAASNASGVGTEGMTGTSGSSGGSEAGGSGAGGSGAGGSGAGGSGAGGSGGDGGSNSALGAAIASSVGLSPDGDTSDDQISAMETQMIVLTRKMIEIRSILEQIDGAEKVKLPSIVVIGSQSSGKSSVLESIVGHEFLPKGSNMVTRRPIELTLVHTSGAGDYCEFPALRSGQISSFKEVQRRLTEMNLAVPESEVVSADPIQLRIYSPHVPDLNLIDLPGYIQVVAAGQPLELKSRIAELCERYIQPPNVILAVSAADVDLANSTALRASRRVDPRGLRTIGVITKMDLVDAERGVDTLLNRQYPLKMGYVGVVTRTATNQGMSSLFGAEENITRAIADSEREFFSSPEYHSVNWGVLTLRDKLTRVLEKSMADGLEPAKQEIRKELAETAYAFKVQYNDRVLTPQSYLAQCADAFKVAFQDMASHFGRDQVREVIKEALDQRGLDLLAETYWNPPPGLDRESASPFFSEPGFKQPPSVDDMSSARPDLLYWQSKVDGLSGTLTKLGVGRLSASMLVDTIHQQMRNLEASSAFANLPLAIEQVEAATDSILSNKYYATADQIENSIKPYKYEVDMDAREWQHSREYAYNLLKEEQRQCSLVLTDIKNEVGASKLKQLMKSLDSLHPTENLGHFSNELIAKARMAAFLQKRIDLLKMRSVFIRSSKCKHSKNKALCPEVFVDVIAAKLASTAVLFLNFELLSDFYYSFPRELDTRLQSLTEDQVESLAHQDPAIKRHVDLQHRKELLTLALNKLQTISDLRELEGQK